MVGLGAATRTRFGRAWNCSFGGAGLVSDLPRNYGQVATAAEVLGIMKSPPIFPGEDLPHRLKVAMRRTAVRRGIPASELLAAGHVRGSIVSAKVRLYFRLTYRVRYWVSLLDGTLLSVDLVQHLRAAGRNGRGILSRINVLQVVRLRFSHYGRRVRFSLPSSCSAYPSLVR
jgi:hypothetical protein